MIIKQWCRLSWSAHCVVFFHLAIFFYNKSIFLPITVQVVFECVVIFRVHSFSWQVVAVCCSLFQLCLWKSVFLFRDRFIRCKHLILSLKVSLKTFTKIFYSVLKLGSFFCPLVWFSFSHVTSNFHHVIRTLTSHYLKTFFSIQRRATMEITANASFNPIEMNSLISKIKHKMFFVGNSMVF